jgi:3'-5' exoribonuclease
MSHIFISDLKPGDKVNQFFLVKRKERRRARNGKDFLDLTLADKTGSLNGKIWSEHLEGLEPLFSEGQFAGVAGRVEAFQDELQLTVEKIRGIRHWSPEQLEKAGFDPDLLVPPPPVEIEPLWEGLTRLVKEEIRHPALKQLTLTLLLTNAAAWKKWPASKVYHHAYAGGLLEHTLKVTAMAFEITRLFPELHRDLVLAGAVLHDIGKLRELEGPYSEQNTFEGQLIGHLIQGRDMIREAAQALEWDDPRLLTQLEHVLLAHHGQLEFGSPVVPQTREALVIHMLDDLEGKLKMMTDQIHRDRGEGPFTDWHRVLKRKILKEPVSTSQDPNAADPSSGAVEESR